MAWVWWLAITLLLGVVEFLVVDLLFFMFAGGALAATVAAALGADIPIQVAVFGVVSVLLLVAIRPWALRRFKDQTPETATNVAAHVGRMAVVLVATSSTASPKRKTTPMASPSQRVSNPIAVRDSTRISCGL